MTHKCVNRCERVNKKSHEHHMRVHQSEVAIRATMNVSQAGIEECPIWVCQWSLCACEELLTMFQKCGVQRAHQKSTCHDYCFSAHKDALVGLQRFEAIGSSVQIL